MIVLKKDKKLWIKNIQIVSLILCLMTSCQRNEKERLFNFDSNVTVTENEDYFEIVTNTSNDKEGINNKYRFNRKGELIFENSYYLRLNTYVDTEYLWIEHNLLQMLDTNRFYNVLWVQVEDRMQKEIHWSAFYDLNNNEDGYKLFQKNISIPLYELPKKDSLLFTFDIYYKKEGDNASFNSFVNRFENLNKFGGESIFAKSWNYYLPVWKDLKPSNSPWDKN